MTPWWLDPSCCLTSCSPTLRRSPPSPSGPPSTPPPGLLDQLHAAADDAHAVMAAESQVLGGSGLIHADHAAVPAWIRLELLTVYATWAAGTGSTCVHSPHVSRPQPVFSAAWKPGLVVCGACLHLLALRRASAADRRCDGCGRVTTGPKNGDGIHPSRAQYGPLLLAYGACRNCLPTVDPDPPEEDTP